MPVPSLIPHIYSQPSAPTPLAKGEWRYVLGDLLWGKVSGHPWWPCLVAEDPFDKAYHKIKGIYVVGSLVPL